MSRLFFRVLELRRVGSARLGDSVGGHDGVEVVLVFGDGFGVLVIDFFELDFAPEGGALAEDNRGVGAFLCVPLVLARRSLGFRWLGEGCVLFGVPFREPLVIRLVVRGNNSIGSALVRPDRRFPSSMKVVGPSASIFFQGGDSTLERRIGLWGVVSRTRRRLAGGSSS